MALYGSTLAIGLDAITDPTTGINKIALDLDIAGVLTAQSVTFDAAVAGNGSATVSLSSPITFAVPADGRTERLLLYNGTTELGFVGVTEVTDSNDFDYVVDSLVITLT